MRSIIFFYCLALILPVLQSCSNVRTIELDSPDKSVQVFITCDKEGHVLYNVKKDNQTVIEPSQLGVMTSKGDFFTHLKIESVTEITSISENYTTPFEKKYQNSYNTNEIKITVQNKENQTLDIVFRASDDGIAFRYYFVPHEGDLEIRQEYTSFKFSSDCKAWLHPHANVKDGWCRTQPSYEENYQREIPVGQSAPQKAGWSFPALFKTGNYWVLISESGLNPPYCGTRLAAESVNGTYSITFPQQGETVDSTDSIYPISDTSFYSPWRVIITGKLSTLVESNMITALSSPSVIRDSSAFQPGIASWSWGMLKDESVNYKTQKSFIDLASSMKWKYCLIDVNWDIKIGYDRIKELTDYAKSRGVGIILWYNSSGPWNTTVYSPKSKLTEKTARRQEFEKISKIGIKGIKVDFWPGDGPSAIRYYYDLLSDAADYGLVVNFHGTTVPRGWSRTFPNLVSMEAVKGFEFTTFTQENNDANPVHCATLPFARNVVGHMDYTPVCFDEIPGIQRRTSNAFELALSIIFQSGIQHIVETPESMANQPTFVRDFLINLPPCWEDIKLLDGYPGSHVVIARKYSGHWYIGGINANKGTKELDIDLSPLILQDSVEIITDGDNNRSYRQISLNVINHIMHINLQPNGGFVCKL